MILHYTHEIDSDGTVLLEVVELSAGSAVLGVGVTFREALCRLVLELRDYASHWDAGLRSAENHRVNGDVVGFVRGCSDGELLAALVYKG